MLDLHDASGNSVSPDSCPPNVPDLPLYHREVAGIPPGMELRYLAGNWYGAGPVVLLWDPAHMVHCDVPEAHLERGLPEMIRNVLGAITTHTTAGRA